MLKVLGMLDSPTAGEVYFKEKNTGELKGDGLANIRRNDIGFIFQDFYLMDSLSVRENIMLPMILNKEQTASMLSQSDDLAKHFELTALLDKKPNELSGGEKQRVAICRALINQPDLVLADEPTGNLDSKSGDIVINTLAGINEEMGKTVVMVTHDPKMASFCKKIIFLKDGEIKDSIQRDGERQAFYQMIVDRMGEL